MAQQGFKFDSEKLCCSICLDLMKDPVTIPCGHNYCMGCIKSHWDGEDQKYICSCPQCRKTFIPRPDLLKNTMLADLVEDLKKTGLQAAPGDHCYAGPEDMACDFCTGRKLKALKSCLQCQVSYCEKHLQPHYESPAFQKHKLVDPCRKLQEDICFHHGEVLKIFCRTDQHCICYMCSMGEHKGHDKVPASAERNERQREIKPFQQKIQQRIQDREKDVKMLQQEVETINHSADEAVLNIDDTFNELIRLIEKRSSDMKKQIRSQQKTEVSRAKELQEKLRQEIIDLRRKDAELEELSHTEDHTHFLNIFSFLSTLSESTQPPFIKLRPLRYFENVILAVTEVKDKLRDFLNEEWLKLSWTVKDVDVLLPQAEPKTRDEFLQFACPITLDPNTANSKLLLSEGNKKLTYVSKKQAYPRHPERFMSRSQVLSRESLTGRHYWEVEWSGLGLFVVVTYKEISRAGNDSEFGNNNNSWALECSENRYEFIHNKFRTYISGPESSRIGVYLDHRAGILSFYGVSDTMTLLHRVQTTFTQPLNAGFRASHYLGFSSTAVLNDLM